MEQEKEKRSDLIHAITSPLGFFALSLLIVEGFLTIALIFSNLDSSAKFIGMIIGAALFIIVVLGVLALVCFKPENLTFSEGSHLKMLEMKNKYGTSDSPQEKVDVESINLVAPIINT
ncbi:MAG: hypothetical protein WCP24_03065 [bacterium]